MLNWSILVFCTYQRICTKNGLIINGPTLCKLFGENDDIKNFIIKSPTYRKKKHLKKMSCYIGEFHMVNYSQMLENYSYHGMLLCLLGKHEWNILIREPFLADNIPFMTKNDYDEALESEFDM